MTKMNLQSQELRKLTHTALKMYVPKEMYYYICGMIDMAHKFGDISSLDYLNNKMEDKKHE